MAILEGKWRKIDQKGEGPGARSSHAIAVVGTKVYAFGGEFSPRVPVDNRLHVFDLQTQSWSVSDATGDVPPPRVGVTMAAIDHTIFVFGGRDAAHNELNEFFSFDTQSLRWTLLATGPPPRSYHSMASDHRHVYVFGGCGVSHRLNDLWRYDAVEGTWLEMPSPGEICKGRGGPGLVVAGGRVWVVYGFAGMEVDDVWCFDLSQQKWSHVETRGEKPSARSVFSTAAFGKHIVIAGGEVDPSDLGHMGAGMFSGDSYSLDTDTLTWQKIDDESGSDNHPGPRGWTAFHGGEDGLLVLGGNSPTNDRLGDIYFLSVK